MKNVSIELKSGSQGIVIPRVIYIFIVKKLIKVAGNPILKTIYGLKLI